MGQDRSGLPNAQPSKKEESSLPGSRISGVSRRRAYGRSCPGKAGSGPPPGSASPRSRRASPASSARCSRPRSAGPRPPAQRLLQPLRTASEVSQTAHTGATPHAPTQRSAYSAREPTVPSAAAVQARTFWEWVAVGMAIVSARRSSTGHPPSKRGLQGAPNLSNIVTKFERIPIASATQRVAAILPVQRAQTRFWMVFRAL